MKKFKKNKIVVVLICIIFIVTGLYGQDTRKAKITEVNFRGNESIQDKHLYKIMVSRPSSFFGRYYYYPDVFRDDLESIELFYKQHGYLEAEITSYDVNIDTLKHEASLSIEIEEGELTRIAGISILGNEEFSDEAIMEKIIPEEGDAFESGKIDKSVLDLLTLYADNGYLDAVVNPDIRVDSEIHRALVDFVIEEKDQYKVGEIRLEGLEKTNAGVVLRELLFKPGDIVRYSRLLKSQQNLYMTGLFQSVYVRPNPAASGDPAKKDILIELKENMSIEFNVSAGYGSVEKVRGKMELFNMNLRGTARKLGFISNISFIQRTVEASFTEPWLFSTRWRMDMNVAAAYEKEPGYELRKTGLNLTVGREFFGYSNVRLTYRRENNKLDKIKVTKIPENIKTKVRSLRFSAVFDTRDNLFNPSRGLYLDWITESGGFYSDSFNRFIRSTARYKYFVPAGSSIIIASALELGWMDARGGLSVIPLNERFYAGGPNSVRGFEYRKMGPLDENRTPTGGRIRFVWNVAEIRMTLYKMIGGVLFFDAGNVWEKPEDFSLKEIRSIMGIGLRVNTPIGLARLDYGMNASPEPGEPGGVLYFSMGQAF